MILVRNLRLGTDEPEDKLKKLAARESSAFLSVRYLA